MLLRYEVAREEEAKERSKRKREDRYSESVPPCKKKQIQVIDDYTNCS